MNYTINYPASASVGTVGQSASGMSVPINSQGQIILTPPTAATNGPTSTNGSTQFPMVMQMTSSGSPFIYTYPDIHNKSIDSSSNSGIGQVVISPVQSGLNLLKNNGNSPSNIATVNIPQEPKRTSARGLTEVFNVQSVQNIQNPPSIIPTNGMPTASPPVTQPSCMSPPLMQHSSSSPDLANLISSLQAAGVVVNNCGQSSSEEKNYLSESNMVSTVPVDGVYRLVDGNGNMTMINNGVASDNVQQPKSVQFLQPQAERRSSFDVQR